MITELAIVGAALMLMSSGGRGSSWTLQFAVPRETLMNQIRSACVAVGLPPALGLATCECESSIHNDRYNIALRDGKYYAYEKLIKEHIERNKGLKAWFQQSPYRNDETAWGSVGVWQVHPHWLFDHIPAGEDHFKYVFDVEWVSPLQAAKLLDGYRKSCAVDMRLRYLGWKTIDYYLGLYDQAKATAETKRTLEQERAISAVNKKIPKFVRAVNDYNDGTTINLFPSASSRTKYESRQT